MQRIRNEQDVDALSHAAKALAVLAGAGEAGLIDALAEGPVARADLPGDPRAVRIVLPILAHLGLVDRAGDRYLLSTAGRRLRDRNALPSGPALDHLADLADFERLLREGGPAVDERGESKGTTGGVTPEDREGTRRFLERLYRGSERSAPEVLRWTAPRLEPGARVLDLGGGHGRYARTFADAGYRATLFDLPLVIELARERHDDALDYLAGDFLAGDDLGGPWDAVLLSNIVHGQSGADNRGLVQRLADALAPGGVIVFKDMFLDDQGRDPERAALFGTIMLLYTDEGQSWSIADVHGWADAAGLERAGVVILDRFSLVIVRRRA